MHTWIAPSIVIFFLSVVILSEAPLRHYVFLMIGVANAVCCLTVSRWFAAAIALVISLMAIRTDTDDVHYVWFTAGCVISYIFCYMIGCRGYRTPTENDIRETCKRAFDDVIGTVDPFPVLGDTELAHTLSQKLCDRVLAALSTSSPPHMNIDVRALLTKKTVKANLSTAVYSSVAQHKIYHFSFENHHCRAALGIVVLYY